MADRIQTMAYGHYRVSENSGTPEVNERSDANM